MNTRQLIRKNKNLIRAFKRYQERYLDAGKKPDVTKFLPEIVYRTMRLEGENITMKQAKTLFR